MKEILDNPRAEIDAIDVELLRLLNLRAAIALKVGEAKRHVDTSLCDPNREQEVIDRLSQQNQGPLTDQSITSIFQRIMDECLHIQQRTFHQTTEDKDKTKLPLADLVNNSRVAFLGEPARRDAAPETGADHHVIEVVRSRGRQAAAA